MADVTKTIENIDKLFSQIIVNGEVHESQNYVPRTPQQITPSSTQNDTPSQTTPSTPSTQTQGEPVYAVELNKVVHDFIDRVVTQDLANEIEARRAADNILEGYINALNALVPASASSTNKLVASAQLQTVAADVVTAQADISDIEALIPNQASQSNQLADKNFVNSSIATNTANFLGTYTSLADIEAIQNPTNNDYAYLQTTDSAGNTQFQRYKYSASDNQWHYEYTLNNSSFTAEQWATINSGLTQDSVESTASSIASTAVSAEATARANADSSLASDISAEATARANADSSLASDISSVSTTALEAQRDAGTANSNASSALTTAQSAQSTANSASSTASSALSTAQSAQSTASSASSTANKLASYNRVINYFTDLGYRYGVSDPVASTQQFFLDVCTFLGLNENNPKAMVNLQFSREMNGSIYNTPAISTQSGAILYFSSYCGSLDYNVCKFGVASASAEMIGLATELIASYTHGKTVYIYKASGNYNFNTEFYSSFG